MKRVRISAFAAVCLTIAMFMSSAVLADDPPDDPGSACDVVRSLPIPDSVKEALLALLGCNAGCQPPCGPL